MAVSEILTGVFSLAAIYDDLTGVTVREALPILTAEAACDQEPLSGVGFGV